MPALSNSIDAFSILAGLLGGLAIFLFGMDRLTDALRATAGGGLKRLLTGLTRNRSIAALMGAILTALVQSSSVTTVLVVGFTSAGLMTLTQSVGVILGSNVGSTVTAQILAFKATQLALPLIAAGFFLQLLPRRKARLRALGAAFFGLGLLFLGMNLMGESTAPLRSYEPFTEFMRSMETPLWGILAGTLFTAVVQSSAATTGIVIAFASQGLVRLEAGIALTLGANIGTCVTALLASLGKPSVARQAAYVHILFNVFGVLIWLGLIPYLAWIVRSISGSSELEGAAKLAAEAPRQIANAHTIFNLLNTLAFLPIAGVLAWMAKLLAPGASHEVARRAQPKFLQAVYLDTPSLALDQVRRELGRFGRLLDRMLARDLFDLTQAGTERELLELRSEARDLKRLYRAIIDYLRVLNSGEMSAKMAEEHERMLHVATHLQNVVDTLASQLDAAEEMSERHQYTPIPSIQAGFDDLQQSVRRQLRHAARAFDRVDTELAREIEGSKRKIRALCDAVLERVGARLRDGTKQSLEAFRYESEAVEMFYRLFYFAKRIAKHTLVEEEL
ncbi:MAG: NAD+ kinase [Planctomycetota bacterium]|nr:MAG: NAD+ kinase [Planctomycetota bacterium]